LAEAMRMVVPAESPLIPYTATMDLPSADAVAEAAKNVITEATANPPLVVVGHGAQCLLHDRPRTLHVRLVAPITHRVQRLQQRFGWDPGHAAAEARRYDADRRAYTQRYYHRNWDDPALYDVQINTGQITLDEATTIVASLVKSRD
jgi:cytidylate kinase